MGHTTQVKDLRKLTLKPQYLFSPVSLRYIAALRGIKPKRTGVEFTYAHIACRDPEQLICLAASNPEGRFYGFVLDEAARRTAEEKAAQHGTFNIVFMVATPLEILARITNGSSLPPMLDYLCCDESVVALPSIERDALYDLAQKRLNPGGLFVTAYPLYKEPNGTLRFLVRELVPEMNEAQKLEFLTEIKTLGALHLSFYPDLAEQLAKAIAQRDPDQFFALFNDTPAKLATFDTMVAMRSRGMTYAGDALLPYNYVEMVVPAEAQELVVKCRNNILYEPIKDFAVDRATRFDIWAQAPVEHSTVAAELFGGFAYGVTLPREKIPTSFSAKGKKIDLSTPLYTKLIDLMSLMPMGIGDFLSHPTGKNEKPEKIIEALQILIACDIAIPMRGFQEPLSGAGIAQPRLVGSYNRQLDKTVLDEQDIWMASQVMGCAVAVPARQAFVIQALNRAGLSNSVSALMPELRRVAHTNVALALLDDENPTPEMAQKMVRDIVGGSLSQWYAYALLEAA